MSTNKVKIESVYSRFISSIESQLGKDIKEIVNKPLSDFGESLRANGNLIIKSYFPFIGRGNVLRDKTVNHAYVEKELDQVLND